MANLSRILDRVRRGQQQLRQGRSDSQATISLLQLRAGQILGSTYFTIRETGNLRRVGETEERIAAVATWKDAP